MDYSTNESKENVAENTDKKPKRKSKKKKKKKDVPKAELSTEKVLQRASDILEMLKDWYSINEMKKEYASSVFSAGLGYQGAPFFFVFLEALQSIDSAVYYSQNTFWYKEIIRYIE